MGSEMLQDELNLLPCPLCGAAVKMQTDWTDGYDHSTQSEYSHRYDHIECRPCGLTVSNYDNEIVDVAKTWNTRTHGEQ